MRQNPGTKRPAHKVSAETRAAVDKRPPRFQALPGLFWRARRELNSARVTGVSA